MLLNKTDLVTAAESWKVAQLLALLNPSAKIVHTQRSAIDVPSLLAEQQYDEAEFSSKAANLWHPLTHDRRIELVFIGDRHMDQNRIRDAVESAMLTQSELRDFLDSWDSEQGSVRRAQTTPNPFAEVPGPARGLWSLDEST